MPLLRGVKKRRRLSKGQKVSVDGSTERKLAKRKVSTGVKKRKKKAKRECSNGCDCEEPKQRRLGKTTVDASLLAVTVPQDTDLRQQLHQRSTDTDSVVFLKQAHELDDAIHRDDAQLAVWRRAAAPAFISALSDPELTPKSLPQFSGTVTPDNAAEIILDKLLARKKRALTDAHTSQLVHDIQQLVQVFSKLTSSSTVRVRLECLGGNGCRLWHQDCVDFRLVATYRGPCTEWVHPDYSEATLKQNDLPSKHAQPLTHHDVALFKGRGESDSDGGPLLDHPGIVHRSPPIKGSGVYRVVLVLDIPQPWMI